MNSRLRPRIKICGIQCREHAIQASILGADAIGLVFYKKSARYISLESASLLAQQLPPFLTVVGLFVDHSAEFVNQALKKIPFHTLQFHGDESPEFCRQFFYPYIKAIQVKSQLGVIEAFKTYEDASAILLDSPPAFKKLNDVERGGTGKIFDWRLVPDHKERAMPVILAGGLHEMNVKAAIKQVLPYAVDVSSGVELERGKKSMELIDRFIQKINDTSESN